jgi:hypothetical protein
MTGYMLKSELEAIVVKHKHQWFEGMVSARTMQINAAEELSTRFVHNVARDLIRKIVAEYEPHPSH